MILEECNLLCMSHLLKVLKTAEQISSLEHMLLLIQQACSPHCASNECVLGPKFKVALKRQIFTTFEKTQQYFYAGSNARPWSVEGKRSLGNSHSTEWNLAYNHSQSRKWGHSCYMSVTSAANQEYARMCAAQWGGV